MAQNKREIIAEAIEAGGATKESLMEVAEVNSAGLASQFTYLRLTGKYPVKGADGVYKLVTEEEWNELKEAAASNRGPVAPKKSPQERKEALEKRQVKLQDAFAKKEEAFAKDSGEMNRLRLQKAEAEVLICNLELTEVTEELTGATKATKATKAKLQD